MKERNIRFRHRTMEQKPLGMTLFFRHTPAPPTKTTLPPRKTDLGRHCLAVSRARPAPLIISAKPPPPRPGVSFNISTTKPQFKVHRRKTVNAVTDLVSIIVLNYNTLEVLKPCIGSIITKTVHPYELIVVDNGSRDPSLEWAKHNVSIDVVVENKQNYGWCKGNNVGIKVARGSYMLLLNSDTVVRTRGWLQKMVEIAKQKGVGTVGAKLLYPNGTIQHIGGGIHKGNPHHPYDHRNANIEVAKTNRLVPFVTGACVLIKSSTSKKVGLLDEHFKLGFGDVDYGLRVTMAGLKNVVCSEAVLTHRWAYTQRKTGIPLRISGLNRYRRKWINRLPQIAKKVKLAGEPYHKG